MKNSTKIIIVVLSLIAAGMLIGGGLWLAGSSSGSTYVPEQDGAKSISTSELTAADGKSGHACWVAIDGAVYEISQGILWVDGVHKSSDNLAYCGADLSKVIDQAPHGRKKLEQLKVIGKLQ